MAALRGIQQTVGGIPAPAVAGDFASANPNRYSVLSGPGGLISGPSGVFIGQFGWLSYEGIDTDNAPAIVNSFGSGAPDGFVSRPDSPAINITYLAGATMLLLGGQAVPLHSSGDFWVVNNGTAQAKVGDKAYADPGTGKALFAATGTPPSSSPAVTGSIATNTAGDAAVSMTGSIAGNVLTVTAVATGHLRAGAILTGPSGVATGTQVVKQLTSTETDGALGLKGTYALSIGEQTVASGTVVGTYGILTVTAGTPIRGGTLTGSSPTATVWDQIDSTHWAVSPSQTAASVTGQVSAVETKWYCRSSGAAGELVKISETLQ